MRGLCVFLTLLGCSDRPLPLNELDGEIRAGIGTTSSGSFNGIESPFAVANAAFVDRDRSTLCPSRRVDNCEVARCATASVLASAGSIAIAAGEQTIVLAPMTIDGSTSYQPYVDHPMPWQAQTKLHIQATGADVPPFEGDVTVPDPITVIAPANDLALAHGAPLRLEWLPGDGLIRFSIFGEDGRASIACALDASLGFASVPQATLRLLESARLTLEALHEAPVEVEAGDWHVRIVGVNSALSADHSDYTRTITID